MRLDSQLGPLHSEHFHLMTRFRQFYKRPALGKCFLQLCELVRQTSETR